MIKLIDACRFLLAVALVSLVGGQVMAQDETVDKTYRLGPGDVISVQVFGEEDLSFEELRLTDSGTFAYPFLGEVDARGKTAKDVEQLLTQGLQGDYLINPRVSVSIYEYRDFFVNGEVRKPGGYPYRPGLTLRKAVALAGGMTERASERRVSIIRENAPDQAPISADMDTLVMPGDIITVDQSFF